MGRSNGDQVTQYITKAREIRENAEKATDETIKFGWQQLAVEWSILAEEAGKRRAAH